MRGALRRRADAPTRRRADACRSAGDIVSFGGAAKTELEDTSENIDLKTDINYKWTMNRALRRSRRRRRRRRRPRRLFVVTRARVRVRFAADLPAPTMCASIRSNSARVAPASR